MTTKSMQMSRSSLTDSHANHKKIIDAEECQAQSDELRLAVDCRISADTSILDIIKAAGIQSQIGMLMETTAKAAAAVAAMTIESEETINPAISADAVRNRLQTN